MMARGRLTAGHSGRERPGRSQREDRHRLLTVELDAERARAAREVLELASNVRVPHGNWHELLAHGPFDMLFVDGRGGRRRELEAVLGALRPGGRVVLDDL